MSSQTEPNQLQKSTALLEQAAVVPLNATALEVFSSSLPDTEEGLLDVLEMAVNRRQQNAFQSLFFSALLAGRKVPASILENGAALFKVVTWLHETALRTHGHAGEALIAAVRSGRLSTEREGLCLALAWIFYDEAGEEFPDELRILTRKKARDCRRQRQLLQLTQYTIIYGVDQDPVLESILAGLELKHADGISRRIRRVALDGVWDGSSLAAGAEGERTFSGGTLERSAPRVGRNDPCPCGSGKKHKKCCFEKDHGFDDYTTGGVSVLATKQTPELLLSPGRIAEMRSYELWQLDPARIRRDLIWIVADRLVLFHEFERAREVLEQIDPDDLKIFHRDDLLFSIYTNEEGDRSMLRWFLEWMGGRVEPFFEMELVLAKRETALEMLVAKADEAFSATKAGDDHARVAYTELSQGAFHISPALGIVIARGVLKDAEGIHHSSLLDNIEDARDEIGLVGEDFAEQVSAAVIDNEEIVVHDTIGLALQQEEAARALEIRRKEVKQLEQRIGSLEDSLRGLRKKAAAATTAKAKAKSKPTLKEGTQISPAVLPSPEEAELRSEIKRLKTTLKLEHSEQNRVRRQLRSARNELASTNTKVPGQDEKNIENDTEEAWLEPMPERMEFPVRVPEFSPACRRALAELPENVASLAVILAGRIAAGDKSGWLGCRQLRQLPGLVRQKVGRNHRLFFRPGADTVEFVDLIDRQDFDTWIRKQHQA